MKKICFVASCYNEEENVEVLYQRIVDEIQKYEEKYQFSFILLDNCSTDLTAEKLRNLAKKDTRVKVILNSRNFGHIRSPYYGIIQSEADATIYMASDLQDPPELISKFIEKWEAGYKIVLGKKTKSEESILMYAVRSFYYFLISKISDDNTVLLNHCTGFGLYDKQVIDAMKKIDDPYPYLRGLICDIGFEKAFIEFTQPTRKRGLTKNNFYTLYDIGMLGIVKHSKVPLRIMTFIGFIFSFISLILAVVYTVLKLVFWNTFNFGLAPLLISIFFFSAVQLFCMGILGEYIGAIYTRINQKPLVIEKERINF